VPHTLLFTILSSRKTLVIDNDDKMIKCDFFILSNCIGVAGRQNDKVGPIVSLTGVSGVVSTSINLGGSERQTGFQKFLF